ncbi:MAG TPA: GtrA family protein [Bryobacteraceae bacterium]|nr:GtrA family protein [Bryobacteraceae bacterium]
MEARTEFRSAKRTNAGLLASGEKRALIWMALRMPAWVKSDHLTALGFLSLIGVGGAYWYARYSQAGLALAIAFLILNWFGDSLDGTLARVRNQQRPRYGFYVDHVLDACGSVCLFGGLALSGYMSPGIAAGLLVAYLLLSIEVYLATYTIGEFHMSFAAIGPTELRLLLIAGNIAAWSKPLATPAGRQYLLFDVGGAIGIAGMTVALLWSMVRHVAFLYRAEIPRKTASFDWPSLLRRWGRFNAVGIAGFALQLGTLWVLARVFGMQYLLATALAVELALLHNFVWHEAWTWPGLGVHGRWRRLARFHVANGFVSIASNVAFTWMLMQGFHLPLLIANTGAVVAAALLNFALAAWWVFSNPSVPAPADQ